MGDSTPRLHLEAALDHSSLVRAFNRLDANRSGRIGPHESWIDVQDFDFDRNNAVEPWEYMVALRLLHRGGGEPFPGSIGIDYQKFIGHWWSSHETDPEGNREPSFQAIKNRMFEDLIGQGLSGDQITALGSAAPKGQNRHVQWEATVILPTLVKALRKAGFSTQSTVTIAISLLQRVPEGVAEAGQRIAEQAATLRASLGEGGAVAFVKQVMSGTGALTGPAMRHIGMRIQSTRSTQGALNYRQALEEVKQIIRSGGPDRVAATLRGDIKSARPVPDSSPAAPTVTAKAEELLHSKKRPDRLFARMILMDGHPVREAAAALHEAGVAVDVWASLLADFSTRELLRGDGCYGWRRPRFFDDYRIPPVHEEREREALLMRDGAVLLKALGAPADDIARLARTGPDAFRAAASLVKYLSEKGVPLTEAVAIAAETTKHARGVGVHDAAKAVESLHAHGIPPSGLVPSLKRISHPTGGRETEPYKHLPAYLEAGYSVPEIEELLATAIEPDRVQPDRYKILLERLGWLTSQGWARPEAASFFTQISIQSGLDAVSATQNLQGALSKLSDPQERLSREKIRSTLLKIASLAGSSTGDALGHLAGAYGTLRFLGLPAVTALERLVQIAEHRGPGTAQAYESLAEVTGR